MLRSSVLVARGATVAKSSCAASWVAAQLGIGGPRSDGGQIVDHASALVEFLVLVLREIVGLGVVAEDVFSRRHRLGAGQNLDHGGLAGAVDAHQRQAVAALDD